MAKNINPPRHKHGLQSSVWSREGIGLETPEIRHRKEAKIGSEVLRQACLDLFQRTANRYVISLSDAMACHLGYHAPPKIIRSPYRTASAMRRLAA